MEGEFVVYQGRNVPKDDFRVFVYGVNGAQKVVESWEEYQREISSGVWHSEKSKVAEKKAQPAQAAQPKPQTVPNIDHSHDPKIVGRK